LLLLVENPGGDAWAFQTKEVAAGTVGAIPAVGIADLLAELGRFHIDVLKIDVEGAEYHLFAHGLSEWIDKVSNLAVEVHESMRCYGFGALVDGGRGILCFAVGRVLGAGIRFCQDAALSSAENDGGVPGRVRDWPLPPWCLSTVIRDRGTSRRPQLLVIAVCGTS